MPPVRHSAQTIWNAAEATCRQKRLEDWDEISILLEIDDKKATEKRSKLLEIDWELSGVRLVRVADKQLADCIDSILAKSSTLSNASYTSPRRTIPTDLLKTLT
jgi:Ebola virus-specific transcription factor VP30